MSVIEEWLSNCNDYSDFELIIVTSLLCSSSLHTNWEWQPQLPTIANGNCIWPLKKFAKERVAQNLVYGVRNPSHTASILTESGTSPRVFLNFDSFQELDSGQMLMTITLQCIAYSTINIPQNVAQRLLN